MNIAYMLQLAIYGLSLGSVYALLALGFSMVYGIMELINFSHFTVFMIGSFIGMAALAAMGVVGQETMMSGVPLAGVLIGALIAAMLASGILGVLIERIALRPLRAVKGPAAMITTIGVSYVLTNFVRVVVGGDAKNYPNPMPPVAWDVGGATLKLNQLLIWIIAIVLMGVLWFFVQRTRLGKAMRATAQDAEAARMMGVDVDRVIMTAFFLGSALAGAAGLIFGLYYNLTQVDIGFTSGLRAFTAAVLGGIGNIPGAMLGGIVIGLFEAMVQGHDSLGGAAWSDVEIFSLLVLVLVFRPAGLLGRLAPQKS
jgi:branched-chain amino acid transport system permease protein